MGVANRQHHHVKRVRLDEQDTSIRLYNPLLFCMSKGTAHYAVSSDPAMIQTASHSRHFCTALICPSCGLLTSEPMTWHVTAAC